MSFVFVFIAVNWGHTSSCGTSGGESFSTLPLLYSTWGVDLILHASFVWSSAPGKSSSIYSFNLANYHRMGCTTVNFCCFIPCFCFFTNIIEDILIIEPVCLCCASLNVCNHFLVLKTLYFMGVKFPEVALSCFTFSNNLIDHFVTLATWPWYLPWVEYAHSSLTSSSIGLSPFEWLGRHCQKQLTVSVFMQTDYIH